MKKIIAFIILITISSFNSFSQNIEQALQGTWISVWSKPLIYEEFEGVSTDGIILEFRDDSLFINNIIADLNLSYQYKIIDSSIVYDSPMSMEIFQVYKDSIKLIIDKKSIDTYIRLPYSQQGPFNIDINTMLNDSWIYSDSTHSYFQRIEFSNHECLNHGKELLSCYNHPPFGTQNHFNNNGSWRIFNMNDKSYFVRKFSPITFIPHEIIGMSEDTIYLKLFIENSFRYPHLIKMKALPFKEIENIKNILKSKVWNVEHINFKEELINKKLHKTFNRFIKQSINKKMKFRFTSDSLKIFNNDSTLFESKWDLTNDGKYIRLINNQTFIEISDIKSDNIVLANNNVFTFLIGLHNYISEEFRIILE